MFGHQCLRAGAIVVLAVAIAGVAPVEVGARVQGEDEAGGLFFYNFKEKFELTYDSSALAVLHDGQPTGVVLEELREHLPGLETSTDLGDWTLFTLPSASDTGEALAIESVLDSIVSLVRELGDKYFFSPVFGSKRYPSVLNGKVIVGFEEDEVTEFAEKVLEDAGVEIHERHFAEMKNVFRGQVVGARSGLEVLELANALAELDFVRWSEPSFNELGGPSSCEPLVPPPTNAELSRSGSSLGPYDPGSGSYGVNAIAAWDLCGGSDGSGPAITVGVAGDGVEKIHPDLNANVRLPSNPATVANFASASPCNPAGAPNDGTPKINCDDHETAVAGIIGMVSGTLHGVGVAPEVRIAPARAACITQTSPPKCAGFMAQLDNFALALDYLALLPAAQDGPVSGSTRPTAWGRTASIAPTTTGATGSIPQATRTMATSGTTGPRLLHLSSLPLPRSCWPSTRRCLPTTSTRSSAPARTTWAWSARTTSTAAA